MGKHIIKKHELEAKRNSTCVLVMCGRSGNSGTGVADLFLLLVQRYAQPNVHAPSSLGNFRPLVRRACGCFDVNLRRFVTSLSLPLSLSLSLSRSIYTKK